VAGCCNSTGIVEQCGAERHGPSVMNRLFLLTFYVSFPKRLSWINFKYCSNQYLIYLIDFVADGQSVIVKQAPQKCKYSISI
jgi:hypothetical protein